MKWLSLVVFVVFAATAASQNSANGLVQELSKKVKESPDRVYPIQYYSFREKMYEKKLTSLSSTDVVFVSDVYLMIRTSRHDTTLYYFDQGVDGEMDQYVTVPGGVTPKEDEHIRSAITDVIKDSISLRIESDLIIEGIESGLITEFLGNRPIFHRSVWFREGDNFYEAYLDDGTFMDVSEPWFQEEKQNVWREKLAELLK